MKKVVCRQCRIGWLSVLALIIVSMAATMLSRGATETWDPAGIGAGGGGTGTWNTTNLNWDAQNSTRQVFTNGNAAEFSGTGGVVTVSGTVNAVSLDFNASGVYQLTGGAIETGYYSSSLFLDGSISAESPVFLSSTMESLGAVIVEPSSTITFSGYWTGAALPPDTSPPTLPLALICSGTGTLIDEGDIASANALIGYSGMINNDTANLVVTSRGAILTATNYIQVGDETNGYLQVSNAGMVDCGACVLGGSGTILSGTVSVVGTASLLSATSSIQVGGTAFGTTGVGVLEISSGGAVAAPITYVNATGTLGFGSSATLRGLVDVEGGAVEGSGSGSALSLNNGVTLDNATLILDVDAGTNLADSLNFTAGSLTLLDDDTLAIDVVNGTQLTQQSYVLATLPSGESISGTFETTNLPAGYSLEYEPGELALVSTASVPEPETWASLLIGLGALAMVARRRS